MKKLLFLLLTFICFKGYSQINTTPTIGLNVGNKTWGVQLGVKHNNILIEYQLVVPYNPTENALAGMLTAGYNFIVTNKENDEDLVQVVFTPSIGYSIYNIKIKETNLLDHNTALAYGAEAAIRLHAGEFFLATKSYHNKSFVHSIGLRVLIANL